MAKRTQLLLLMVAILLGLVAAWLVSGMLNKVKQAHAEPTVSVVTVTHQLGGHQVVLAQDVKVTQIPAPALPAGAVTNPNKVIGHYTAGDWFVGQTVLADMVTSSASNAAFPLTIPVGDRAYTLADDPIIGVDHLISAGDHVDVLVTYGKADSGNKGQPVAKTVLQNVLVLYVDNPPVVQTTASVSSSGKSGTGSGSASSSPGGVDSITLALSPVDAQKLDYARTFGQVQLILRNPKDTGINTVAPTTHQP
ncbi:Flp pilus assembly protein CpaB [Alicyclobacillus mengziensis]|uniref:Flp pilus assembly protein CpaB n=1 Tax=Alicyclobacillus mengziensis TaxID=2931921 RepID=A0A9X7VZZ9_9BACL|nr:Flp pilus assembly protein CpaB [Alicyclobacillus mengziensis]QSO48171.1 Flp pilus assembly protein CpaB [Alicyclobacillus mengziensis]